MINFFRAQNIFAVLFQKTYLLSLVSCLCVGVANAVEFKSSGYVTGGVLDGAADQAWFLGDFNIRAEVNHQITNSNKIGMSYALDEIRVSKKQYAREAMVFLENSDWGRMEIGLTSTVASKLGVGLPDVGGLRMNDHPLLLKHINPGGAVFSGLTISTSRAVPRINLVTKPGGAWQFGVSAAGLTNKYNFSADVGAKYKQSDGKTKTTLSFGATFTDAPERFSPDTFGARITADWMAQVYTGLNLQYNSWIWGTTFRVIYNENQVGAKTDGFIAGTGLSYDILNYSVSGTYMLSATGVWDDARDFYYHTGVLSFRYKYNEWADLWMSAGGQMNKSVEPFVSAGLRLTF